LNTIQLTLDIESCEYDYLPETNRALDLVEYANDLRIQLESCDEYENSDIRVVAIVTDNRDRDPNSYRDAAVTFEFDRDNLANRAVLEYVTGLDYDDLDYDDDDDDDDE